MRRPAFAYVSVLLLLVSLMMVSCSPKNKSEQADLKPTSLLQLLEQNQTYSFEGELSLAADLPSFQLITMRTLSTVQNLQVSWKGNVQRIPFQAEADFTLLADVKGTEMELPGTFLATEHDIYISMPAITQDMYIHQHIDEGIELSNVIHFLNGTVLEGLHSYAKETASASSLTYDLDKTSIDFLLQQLLFYEAPKQLISSNSNQDRTYLSWLSTGRDNYLSNKDYFFEMVNVKKANLLWDIDDIRNSIKQNTNIELDLDDGRQRGNVTLVLQQKMTFNSKPPTFVHNMPASKKLLPLKDIISLIDKFSK